MARQGMFICIAHSRKAKSTSTSSAQHLPCQCTVRSLMNKMDELKIWTLTQKWLMDCNVMFFTETWLCNDVPNSVVHMDGRSFFRADRVAATCGKNKGGGVCIYVNKSWCTDSVIVDTYCSADLEFLIIKCRPFYLPREFTCIVAAAVYVPPDTNANVAMKELCAAISKLQTLHPDGAFIVAEDFNHCTLRSVLPKFHQNVSCTTRGHKTLDHVYTNVTDAYILTWVSLTTSLCSCSPSIPRSSNVWNLQ